MATPPLTPAPTDGKVITVTVTGIITDGMDPGFIGTDNLGVFAAPKTSLVGDAFTAVMTIDPSKGTNTPIDVPTNGMAIDSYLNANGTAGVISTVLTINNRSYTFVEDPTRDDQVADRVAENPYGYFTFDSADNHPTGYGSDAVSVSITSSGGAPWTTAYDWATTYPTYTLTASDDSLVAATSGFFITSSDNSEKTSGDFQIQTISEAVGASTPTPTTGSFTVQDQTTGKNSTLAGTPYSGPVAGLTSEFVTNTSDILNITAQTPNSFIEIAPITGSPQASEAGISVASVNGNNILDAYANSVFYTGGTGDDSFYEDTRTLTSNSWSTVVNFHSGDNITLWGVTLADFTPNWIGDTYGATGSTGLTGVFVPTKAGQPEAAVTLAGFKMSDLTDGKLAITYGQTATTGNVAGSTYLSIHAN